MSLVALAGGVGAARFLAGLVHVVPPADIVAIVNTADDDEFHGLLRLARPRLVTYTLAGASNVAQGWGLEGETFATLDALDRYDVPTWFRLGDKDLATHLYRTATHARGRAALDGDRGDHRGVGARPAAPPDDRRSRAHAHHGVRRDDGDTEELAMQRWFVGERAESPVVSVRFDGADAAATRRPACSTRSAAPTRS